MKSLMIDRPQTPMTHSGDASGENWTMIFVLDTELQSQTRRRILDTLGLKAAFVRQTGERLALSVGVTGAMDEAMAIATSAVMDALETAARTRVKVVEARMVGHNDIARQIIEHVPITFYGVTECAKALGISRQRVRQLIQENKLPDPDALVNGKPAWEAASFDHFASERTDLVSRTTLGHDPRKTAPGFSVDE